MRTASVLLLTLLAPAARADEPVPLKWALKPGDTFYTSTRVTQSHAVVAGDKKDETALTMDIALSYHVTDVKDGTTIVEVTYLAVRVTSEKFPEVAAIGEKVRGSVVALRFDKNHAITGVRGHAEVLKKFRDAPANERATAETLLGEAGVRELAGRPFDLLPPKALRVGETTTRDDEGAAGGVASTGKTTFKVESVTDGIAKVSVKSDLTLAAGAGAPAGAKIDLKSERAGGNFTFDTRTGRLKEFAHETVITGTIATGETALKVAIRQKHAVTLSDKNPVRD
jgi:hypothetical protein